MILSTIEPVKKIVVLSTSALGELLVTLPLLQESRRIYPDAKITLVCSRKAVARFAEELQTADDIQLLPANARRSPIALFQSIRLMQALQPDILFQAFASHGTLGNILAGASQAKIRCGFSGGRFQSLLTHRIPIDPDWHRITCNVNLLRRLGHADAAEPTGRYLPQIEARSKMYPGGHVGNQHGPYAVLSIGSDPTIAFKRWPIDKWVELCKLLSLDGITPIFVGDNSIREDGDAVIRAAGGSGLNLAGETQFTDLAALILSSKVVIATDGMILHFAAAMHKTCVGIFGPSHPSVGGPWGDIHLNVSLSLPCSPCYGAHSCGKGAGCTTHECLTHLSARRVYSRVTAISSKTQVAGLRTENY